LLSHSRSIMPVHTPQDHVRKKPCVKVDITHCYTRFDIFKFVLQQ
jgi:hypothetical protein